MDNIIQNVDITTATKAQLIALSTVLDTISSQVSAARTAEESAVSAAYANNTDAKAIRITNLAKQKEKVQEAIAKLQD